MFMKFVLFLLVLMPVLIGQPAVPPRADAVLDDLQARVSRALSSLRERPPLTQQELRGKLERSLGLDRVLVQDDVGAQLYTPLSGSDRMPAVIVVEPHSDKSGVSQEVLPATLARLGFLTIVVDTFGDHSRFDRLAAGITPETLMQIHIRSALSYLLSRSDVDSERIALVADSFAGTIAAGMNPELSAVVLTHGSPDLEEEHSAMRNPGVADLPDGCLIVPGLLDYVDATKMFAAIAPRPLLLFEARRTVWDNIREIYASQGSQARLTQGFEMYGSQEWRMAIYRWLQAHLMNDSFVEVSETGDPANVVKGRLPAPPSPQPRETPQPEQITQALLDGLLGAQLPAPKWSIVMQVAPSQRVAVFTQPGIEIPMTVLRPGDEGGGNQNGIVVVFSDAGRESLKDDPFLIEAVRRNWMIWLVDPRGFGEMKSTADAFVFAASTLLGENFAWRQAADIARIITEYALPMLPHRVGLYATGKLSSLVAGYAVTIAGSKSPEWIIVREGPVAVEDYAQLPLYAVPFATQNVFAPQDLFRAISGNAVFFGEPPADFVWR